MRKVRSPTATGLLASLIAAVAMALLAYLGAFENLSAWIRQVEPGQLGGLFAVFVVLTVALGIYGWRARSQLQRQATQHEREVGELELELTKLRHTREALAEGCCYLPRGHCRPAGRPSCGGSRGCVHSHGGHGPGPLGPRTRKGCRAIHLRGVPQRSAGGGVRSPRARGSSVRATVEVGVSCIRDALLAV